MGTSCEVPHLNKEIPLVRTVISSPSKSWETTVS